MTSRQAYAAAETLHTSSQAFAPTVPVAVMPYAATVLLALAFLLTFFFTTLPKGRLTPVEFTVALAASVCTGFGTVALFNAVGVHV